MDIFNGNRKLEEVVMSAIDWGVFLRHDLEGPLAPFMFLYNGNEVQTRVLMTEADPMEYALKVLKEEENPFQQFVIGIEGYLRDELNNRTDSIIVQGFDKTKAKGVVLGQMFEPKEKQGTFKKIGKVSYLGNPELPIAVESVEAPDYSVEELGFNAIALKNDDLTEYVAFFTHSNASTIANAMKRFIRSKISGQDSNQLNGKFNLQINPGEIKNSNLLKFLTTSVVTEEKNEPYALDWCQRNGRKIKINITHGDELFLSEFSEELAQGKASNDAKLSTPESSQVKRQSSKEQIKKPWWKLW